MFVELLLYCTYIAAYRTYAGQVVHQKRCILSICRSYIACFHEAEMNSTLQYTGPRQREPCGGLHMCVCVCVQAHVFFLFLFVCVCVCVVCVSVCFKVAAGGGGEKTLLFST